MYQGKFNQKKATPPQAPESRVQEEPVLRMPEPEARPVQASPAPVKKLRKQPRLGSVIFYTLYVFLILVVCGATALGLNWLDGWLVDFEASQPTVRAEETFRQLFADPDWQELYAMAQVEDGLYEGAGAFAGYMEDRAAGQELTYVETSAGLSGDKKYNVRLGNEKVASFTLHNHNTAQEVTTIPDWQLGMVELFFQREQDFRIVKLDSHTATVNGVALEESDVMKVVTTVAEDYLPVGVSAPRISTLGVTDLLVKPEVKVFDKDGKELAVAYDEESRTFTASIEAVDETIPDDLKKIALDASEYYALWMRGDVTDKKTLQTYFLAGTETYESIIRTTTTYVQEGSGYEFTDVSVTDYVRYSEDCFSVRVDMNLSESRSSGSVKQWPYGKSMVFQKQSGGNWLCTASVNLDLSEEVGRSRLTFMQDDMVLSTEFYATDSRQIITPILSAPQGKAFAGWGIKSKDDQGNTVLEVIFQPDASGHVALAEGESLEPMVLYAHFVELNTEG